MAEPLEILDLPRESWTLVGAVRAQGRRLGDRAFLSFADGEGLSFVELDRGSDRVASGLARLGLEPGDRALALLRNSAAFMPAMLGAQKRGAISTPINTELRGAFLAVPRFVEVVAALDKTATGKIRKQELRQAGVTASTWDREAAGDTVPR